MEMKPEGWWRPMDAIKEHYFRSGRSLCCGWGYFPGVFLVRPEPPDDHCRTCWKKRERELTKKTETEP